MPAIAEALEQPGTYWLRAPQRAAAGAFADLRIGRSWASLLIGSTDHPLTDATTSVLRAQGFRPPDPSASSTSGRQWFQSWSLNTAEERSAAAAEISAAAMAALGAQRDAALAVDRRPSYEGDPRRPIAIVLGAILLGYCVVVDWIVLLLWDTLVPARAHPSSATALQVVVPILAAALFVAYAVVVPRLRLAWGARRRAPSPGEVDGVMPGLTIVGLALPPVLLVALLVIVTG